MSLSDCFSSDDLVNVALALTLQRKKKRKSRWSKPWLLKRDSLSHEGLLNELRLEPVDYFSYLRMDEQTYSELLLLLTPLIKRQDTVKRKAISPQASFFLFLFEYSWLFTFHKHGKLLYSSIISLKNSLLSLFAIF